MRRPHRSIETFDISLIAVITKAMGAFLVLMLLLLPYYSSSPLSRNEGQALATKVRDADAQIADVLKRLGDDSAKADLTRVRDELGSGRQLIEQLTRAIDQMSGQVTRLEDRIKTLAAEIEGLKQSNADLTKRAESAEADNKRLQTTNSQLAADKAALEAEIEKLKQQVAALQAQIAELSKQVSTLQEPVQEQIGPLKDRIAELERQLAESRALNEQLQAQVAQLNQTVAELKAKLEALVAQLAAANAQLAEAIAARAAMADRNQALIKQMNDMRAGYEDKISQMQKFTDDQRKQIDALLVNSLEISVLDVNCKGIEFFPSIMTGYFVQRKEPFFQKYNGEIGGSYWDRTLPNGSRDFTQLSNLETGKYLISILAREPKTDNGIGKLTIPPSECQVILSIFYLGKSKEQRASLILMPNVDTKRPITYVVDLHIGIDGSFSTSEPSADGLKYLIANIGLTSSYETSGSSSSPQPATPGPTPEPAPARDALRPPPPSRADRPNVDRHPLTGPSPLAHSHGETTPPAAGAPADPHK